MFSIVFIVFILIKHTLGSPDPYGINVGSVLFTESDNSRKCWSNEELALLRARLVFQDVLPKTSSLAMDSDNFVTALVSYFRLAVEKVKSMTAGKVREINMKALTDAIGGYLHNVVIPLSKHAFYAGKINYDSARELTELYDEMKAYLRTDGQSWTPPIKVPNKAKRETPINDSSGLAKGSSGGCNDLVYSKSSNGQITIPMPFLDSKTNPTSIALPFKAFPLRNLKSKSSASILSRYYDTAMACMKEQNASEESVNKFNHDFNAFLDSEIMPHLNDEELYPAFGSVYPVKEALAKGGRPAGPVLGGGTAGPNAAAGKAGPTNETAVGEPASSSEESEYYNEEDKSTTIMFSAVAVVILIWIITGIIYCCCRMRRKHRENDKKMTDASMRRRSSTKTSHPEIFKPECPTEKKGSKDMRQMSRESIKPKHPPKPAAKPPEKTKEKKAKEKEKPTRKSGGVCSTKCKNEHPKTPSPRPSTPPPKPKCPKCKRTKCGHGLLTVGSVSVSRVRSAPVSLKKPGPGVVSEKPSSGSNTSAEKPVVFGYDFETSSSDSSSIADTSSSSGPNSPKRL